LGRFMNTYLNTLRYPARFASVFNDRVFQFMVLAVTLLALLVKDQAFASMGFTGSALIHIIPFFLAAYAKASGADQLIAHAFSGNATAAIIGASLAGALSPFCSCGVIPVIAGMLASGVPLAPVMAFCIASPIMDPEMFILTAAGISVEFAIVKTGAAIGMGLLSGYTVFGLKKLGYLNNPAKRDAGCDCDQSDVSIQIPARTSWKLWRDPLRMKEFFSQLKTNGLFLGKWMTVAFLIESLMIAYMPAKTIAGLVGTENAMAIPISAVLGIPAYMNGYAAIPLIAGLMDLGMAPGAALAFVIAGAVSSVPAAMAVFALVKRSVFFVYIATGWVGSVAAGYLYNLL